MSTYRVKAIKRRQAGLKTAEKGADTLSELTFAQLRKKASTAGLFKVGMKKADLIDILSKL